MDVSDVLRDRMQEPSGLQRMAAISLLGHAAVLALVIVAPGHLFGAHDAEPKAIMTISLGGGVDGPSTGGLTALSSRPVQAVTPPDAKPELSRPAAAATPSMTEPVPGKTATKSAAAVVKQAPAEAKGRTPTRGTEVTPGTAVADTGVRGQGFGLSTSSGGGGSPIKLDVDFCCNEYILMLRDRILQVWNGRSDFPATVVVRFVIDRDGTLRDPRVEKPSGSASLDLAAQRAIVTARQMPPLPTAYTNPSLTVHFTFEYITR
jgi:TonB family protein